MSVSRLLEKLTAHGPAKVLSLAMAIFLFAFHSINLLKTRTIASDLQIEGATGLIITNIIPERVSVRLRGVEKDIADISGGDIITYIDLSRYSVKGSHNVPIQVIKSGAALDVDPLEISVEPSDIQIRLDNKAAKRVKITPVVFGRPAEGFDLVSEAVSPDEALLEGPAMLIDKVSVITTESLDITNRYTDFSVMLPLVRPSPLFSIVGSSQVEYSAKIAPALVSKVFAGIPIAVRNLDGRFTASLAPEAAAIRISGSYAEAEGFVPPEEFLFVDCSGIEEVGRVELPVTFEFQGQSAALSVEPASVIVEVTETEGETTTEPEETP